MREARSQDERLCEDQEAVSHLMEESGKRYETADSIIVHVHIPRSGAREQGGHTFGS
jgi:hypothetical protein